MLGVSFLLAVTVLDVIVGFSFFWTSPGKTAIDFLQEIAFKRIPVKIFLMSSLDNT
jgi:hypothetical protein